MLAIFLRVSMAHADWALKRSSNDAATLERYKNDLRVHPNDRSSLKALLRSATTPAARAALEKCFSRPAISMRISRWQTYVAKPGSSTRRSHCSRAHRRRLPKAMRAAPSFSSRAAICKQPLMTMQARSHVTAKRCHSASPADRCLLYPRLVAALVKAGERGADGDFNAWLECPKQRAAAESKYVDWLKTQGRERDAAVVLAKSADT